MQITNFMMPASQVPTCEPSDTIKKAIELLMAASSSACVVIVMYNEAVGIVTKTDLLKAYQQGLPLEHPLYEVMTKNLEKCSMHLSKDQAAAALEKSMHNHAIVVDEKNHFQGVISTWDIAAECAKDFRAYPWNRSADGKFHKPSETLPVGSPTSTMDIRGKSFQTGQQEHHMGDSFRDYVDHLGYFD